MNDDFGDDFGYDDAYGGGSHRQSIIGQFDENPFRAKMAASPSSSKRPVQRNDPEDMESSIDNKRGNNTDQGEKLPPGVRIRVESEPVQQTSQRKEATADDRTRFDGILHRMKAGFMGRVLWTPVWCFIDDYRIVQYKDGEKPRSYRIKPIFQLDLDKCTVEETKVQGKQFCFKVTEKKSSNSCIYACEFEKDLDFLLVLMNKQAVYKAQRLAEQQRQQQEEQYDDFQTSNDVDKSPMKYQSEDIDGDDTFDDEVKPTPPPQTRASVKPSSVNQLFNSQASARDDRANVRGSIRAPSKRESVKPQPVSEDPKQQTYSDIDEDEPSPNEADEVQNFTGCMYRLKSGLFGRSIWNLKWVYVDEEQMVQWDSSSKPSSNGKPVHIFDLNHCVIEPYEKEYEGKKYAFKVVDRQEGLSCIYAFAELEQVPYVMPLLLKRTLNLAAQVNRKSYQQVPPANDDEENDVNDDEEASYPKQATPFKSANQPVEEEEEFDIDDEIKHYEDDEEYVPPPSRAIPPPLASTATPAKTASKMLPIPPRAFDPPNRAEGDNFSDLSDFMPMQEDIIIDHFEKNNILPEVGSVGDASIMYNQVQPLLKSLNGLGKKYINPLSSLVIFKDLGIPIGTSITCNEFLTWWQEFVISNDNHIRNLRNTTPFPLGTASNLPEEEIKLSHMDMFAILKVPVIPIKRVEIRALRKPSLEQDWNGLYQHALDIATGVIDLRTKHSIVPVDRNPSSSIATMKESSYRRKKFFLRDDDASSIMHDPTVESDDSYWTPTPVSIEDMDQKSIESILFSDLLNFQSLLGSFYQTAFTGAQMIINEYILPDYLKSTTLFRIPLASLSSAVASSSIANAMLPSVFGYDGLIFRIVDINSNENSEKLAANTNHLPIDLMNITDANRKVILQDFLGKNLLTESNLRILDRYIDHENANSALWNISSSVMKVSTLLSTIVDYAGYRFYVLAPVDISEYQSLTYGFCLGADEVTLSAGQHIALAASRLSPATSPLKTPRSPLATQQSAQTVSSSATSTPRSSSFHPSSSGMKTYPFVDAMVSRRPSVDVETTRRAFISLFDELAIETNTSLTSYEALSSSSAAAAHKSAMGYVRNFQLLSKRMQLHVCRDNRRYLINTENVLPADHPSKAQSMDVFIKKFRPEYIRKLSVKVSPDTFIYPDPAPSSTRVAASMIAVHQLYSEELQSVASDLDSLADHPFDSYTFTKYIHHHGLNCRHLGDLYILCDKPAIQEVILIECIARCCKTIFNRALRGLLVGSLQDVDAIIRSLVPGSPLASEESIFHEQNQTYLTAMKEIIVKLFNIVLGSNSTSQNFWKGPLADLFEKKFGLSLPHEHAIYYPRLFLALQYHTGNIFHDRTYTFINANIGRQAFVNTNGTNPRFNRHPQPSTTDPNVLDISEVFTEEDIISVCQPHVKFWTVFPGPFLHCAHLGESLKHLGLYRDALSIHRVLLSSYHTACSGIKSTNKIQCLIADAEYQYAETLFLSGLYDDARRVLTSCKYRARYTISMGRILTLFMRVEFHAGDYLASLTYYSEALEIYEYLFGPTHGTKSRLAITLAQLFCQSLGYTPEAVEIALGYITKAYESLDRVDSTKAVAKITLGNRLGQLYLKEQLYQEAMEELSQVAKDIQFIRNKKRSNKSIERAFLAEKISCLYHLALCQYQCNYKDLAIDSAMGYLNLCNSTESQESLTSQGSASEDGKARKAMMSRETITIKRILADLFIHSSISKHDMALTHLTEAWTAITSSPREFHEILDDTVTELSYQMASVLLLMQTVDIRRYLETIDTRVMTNAEGKVNDESLWNESRDIVMKAIWSGKCKDYMTLLIVNLHKYSSDGRIDERRISREGLSFVYQTAVFVRMGRKFKRVVLTPDILLQ